MNARVGLFAAGLGLGIAACAPGASVPPPVETSLRDTDPLVAQQLTELLERARADPGSARARAQLGMAYEMSGRLQAALQSYSQAADLDPDEPRWHYFEALAQAELGDLEAALAVLDRVLALDSSYPAAHLFRGEWLLDLGRVEEAGQAYARATQLARLASAPWIGIAKVHLRSGRPEEALQILEQLLNANPDNAYLNQLAGQAYREMGDLERARVALSKAKPGAKHPHWADPWRDDRLNFQTGYGAGMIEASKLMKVGKVAEAIELMEHLRTQQPDDRQLLNNLSVAYRSVQQSDRAFEVLRDGLERHPDYHPFHLNISADYQRMGDIDQALWHLGRVVEISPTFALGWDRIGSIHLGRGDLPQALEAYEKAARQDPDSSSYQLYCGVILGRLERWEESSERLLRALEIRPDHPVILIPLARAYAEMGRFDEAQDLLDRARSIAPDSEHLQQSEERLAELRAASR